MKAILYGLIIAGLVFFSYLIYIYEVNYFFFIKLRFRSNLQHNTQLQRGRPGIRMLSQTDLQSNQESF